MTQIRSTVAFISAAMPIKSELPDGVGWRIRSLADTKGPHSRPRGAGVCSESCAPSSRRTGRLRAPGSPEGDASSPPEERHRKFLADYDRYYGGGAAAAAERARVIRAPVSTDADVVRTTFRFLRSEEDDAELGAWEARMARRYYDKLFKEYCIADLSRYREQKIGMRWRVEKEVVTGKGQFSCGEKRCDATTRLASYEVHFGYREAGERKEALVKLRVCESCARKLNHGRASAFPKVSEASGDGRRRRSARATATNDANDGAATTTMTATATATTMVSTRGRAGSETGSTGTGTAGTGTRFGRGRRPSPPRNAGTRFGRGRRPSPPRNPRERRSSTDTSRTCSPDVVPTNTRATRAKRHRASHEPRRVMSRRALPDPLDPIRSKHPCSPASSEEPSAEPTTTHPPYPIPGNPP